MEIEAIKKYMSTLSKKEEIQVEQNKINVLLDKQEKERQDSLHKSDILTLNLTKSQSDLNIQMKEWSIQQKLSADQAQFDIDMMGKTALEVSKLTAERRIQLDVEERIRQARKSGDVSDETVSRIQAEAAIAKARATSLMDQADEKQRDPWFNASESVRKYGEQASNTGAQIGEAMTHAFSNAEDALTKFLMTGKLDFKSFANSIIADLMRIQARKLVSGIGSGIFGLFGGGGATALDGTTLTAGNAIDYAGQGFADGGSPPLGVPSLVGERGPELFIPQQSGTIVPNHELGGTSVTYAPVIHIDSRTDQEQVYALVMNAVQQGNAQLVEKLQRSNKLRN